MGFEPRCTSEMLCPDCYAEHAYDLCEESERLYRQETGMYNCDVCGREHHINTMAVSESVYSDNSLTCPDCMHDYVLETCVHRNLTWVY